MVKTQYLETVYNALSEVMDPEIPVLSLVDLGVIVDVKLRKNDSVLVKMRPTFLGCPALEKMKEEVELKLIEIGFNIVEIEIVLSPAWTSDEISDHGRNALREYGYAPPPKGGVIDDIEYLEYVQCPQCNGTNTELKSPFGPTLCRSIHYCHDCLESFQQIKPMR